MTLNDSTATPVDHTYRFKPWVILLHFFLLLFISGLTAISGVLFAGMLASPYPAGFEVFQYTLLCLFIPALALLALVILQQIINLIQCFNSRLRITPEGIENRMWPYRHIFARWDELDRLGKLFFNDVLYLKSYRLVGLSLSYTWPFKYLNFSQSFVSVSSYQGWPSGPLAADIKHYAPRLFEPQPVPAGAPVPASASPLESSPLNGQVVSPAAGSAAAQPLSQETRLLAALSHAAVLFSGIGLFVPLIIYSTQRKKSAYLAFQALQAFIFQLAGVILSFIIPFCVIGVAVLGVVGVITSKPTSFEPVQTLTLMLTVAFTLLFTFFSLAFLIYGLVGAVLTYQGKPFRYLIIANQLEKRNITDSEEILPLSGTAKIG